MKKILVPTDFSDNALNAIRFASHLAVKMGAEVTLLHVNFISSSENLIVETQSIIRESAELEFTRHLKKIHGDDFLTKANFECAIEFGSPVDEICEFAKKGAFDLIVMGTEGASGFGRVLLGSNTASVVGHSEVPVLAVPADAKFKEVKKILYATDFIKGEIPVITQLVAFAALFNAELEILHVVEPGDSETVGENERDINFKKIGYEKTTYKVERGNSAYEIINTHVEKQGVSILSMMPRHRNFFEKIFGFSMTKRMAFHSSVPLLTFHN